MLRGDWKSAANLGRVLAPSSPSRPPALHNHDRLCKRPAEERNVHRKQQEAGRSIHKPSRGRMLKIPPSTSKTPAGMRTQRACGSRSQRSASAADLGRMLLIFPNSRFSRLWSLSASSSGPCAARIPGAAAAIREGPPAFPSRSPSGLVVCISAISSAVSFRPRPRPCVKSKLSRPHRGVGAPQLCSRNRFCDCSPTGDG